LVQRVLYKVGDREPQRIERGQTTEVDCPQCHAPVLVMWAGRAPGSLGPLCPVCSAVVPLPVGTPSEEVALAWIWELCREFPPRRGLRARFGRWARRLGGG